MKTIDLLLEYYGYTPESEIPYQTVISLYNEQRRNELIHYEEWMQMTYDEMKDRGVLDKDSIQTIDVYLNSL